MINPTIKESNVAGTIVIKDIQITDTKREETIIKINTIVEVPTVIKTECRAHIGQEAVIVTMSSHSREVKNPPNVPVSREEMISLHKLSNLHRREARLTTASESKETTTLITNVSKSSPVNLISNSNDHKKDNTNRDNSALRTDQPASIQPDKRRNNSHLNLN